MSAQQQNEVTYRGRRVLVTGVTGFIGRWVAHELSGAGAELVLTARDADFLRTLCREFDIRGEIRSADLSQPGTFAALCRDVRPLIVFNFAGYGIDRQERDPEIAAALNTRLVAEIAETLAAEAAPGWNGLRLVHTGSAFEYGNVDGPVREDTPAAPMHLYGQTKLAGTQRLCEIVQRTGLRAATARLFTVYGPGEHAGRLLPSLIAASRTGEALPMTGGAQERDFTYVGDVAEGLLRIGLQSAAPAIVNLATGRLNPVRRFVETAAAQLKLAPGQLQLGAIPYRADELKQGVPDINRLKALLGWQPACTIEEGIRRTIALEAPRDGRRGERVTA